MIGSMRALAILVLAGACNAADPDVRVERQASALADATDADWQVGGAVLVGPAGSFAFPQHVALRISLVDGNSVDAEGVATPLPIETVSLELHGTAAADISIEPTCDALVCTAELLVLEAGSTMLEVVADGPDDSEGDCFYYAVQEDADPVAASESLRTELEAQQTTCRTALQQQ
jgi:hypothetical protein